MKGLVAGALALGVLGSAGYLSLPLANGARTAVGRAEGQASATPAFLLVKAGADEECAVTTGDTLSLHGAKLEMSADCAGLLPGLASARYWRDNDDGTISFVSEAGLPVVEFFAADGVAYESFRPVTPLLSLQARE